MERVLSFRSVKDRTARFLARGERKQRPIKVVSGRGRALCVKVHRQDANPPPDRLRASLLHPFACYTSRLHMSSSSLFGRFTRWLKQLGRNPYFWSGIAGLVAMATIVYFLFNAVLMPSYTRHDASLNVPDVLDRSFDDAQEVIKARGLDVERQVGRYNPRVAQDQVVDQTPPPGSPVKPGRRIYLTVNSGTAPVVSVPDLSGTSLREARNRLTSLGLEVGRERIDSIPSPYAETVTRQRPEPGDSLKKGAPVDIWYSRGLGNERMTVPDVRGVKVEVAERLLLQRKLRSVVINSSATEERNRQGETRENDPGRADTPTDRQPPPLWVREQGLKPGTTVRSGTEVRLFATPDSTAVPRPDTPTPQDSLRGKGNAGSSEDRDVF